MQGQSLALVQRQQLQMVLAPQLRQSLEMLQKPVLELRTLIRQELEQNPTLEEVPEETQQIEIEQASPDAADERGELKFDDEFDVLAKLDDEWREYFFQDLDLHPTDPDREERRQFLFDSYAQPESLQEHLLEQLRLTGLTARDQTLGELIIGSIDEDGYLSADLAVLARDADADPEHLQDVLAVIQDFHPTGIAARNLQECLLLQLARLEGGGGLAATIVREHLDLLAGHKYAELAKLYGVSVDDVIAASKVVAAMNPKPGRIFTDEATEYVAPEVVVVKGENGYEVVVNDEHVPHVRISRQYREMLANPEVSAADKSYIRERIRAGAFLMKSIHQRQKTIHRIATEIVRAQTDFLDNGIARLRPMTMSDVAQSVGVHETTVSRAVSGKYMRTPVGLFEMKYFFTPGIKTTDGRELSNKTVKDMIAHMVAQEDIGAPLSDQEIMDRLQAQGITIARRTVAKYRIMLRIPPSHERRR